MAASIFQLVGEIAINAEKAHRTIDNTTTKANGLAKNFNKVGAVALKVGKATVAGAAAVAAGIGTLLKASITNYAEYEQLVGGVETLFKDSSGKVMEYANNAYKTAGLTANEYMKTVTSFSASLLQSMKGDTEGAADVANMALTDMADNANKMGTSMSSIQDAYQGFAKQNYTMLDNLKLGYGGTQSEMKRLLKDAQKISKQKYNIKNFNDIIEAIHVIQTEMGITGTTAEEASKTISGSFSALGSAWTNLLTGMSTDGADMDLLMKNVFDAAENVAVNIGRLLPVFAKHLGEMLGSLGQYAGQKIKSVWTNTVYPKIQEFLKVNFGIDLPDWQTVKTKIVTLWQRVEPNITGLFTAVFSIFTPDESGEGQSTAARILQWWMDVIVAVGNLVLSPFGLSFPDAVGEINTWWEGVKEQVALTLGFSVSPSGVHTSTDGEEHGGGEGRSFRIGLNRVPYDGYRAILHKDEAVLRASEAAVWRGEKLGQTVGSGGSPVTVVQNIQAVPMSASELVAETKFALGMMRFAT